MTNACRVGDMNRCRELCGLGYHARVEAMGLEKMRGDVAMILPEIGYHIKQASVEVADVCDGCILSSCMPFVGRIR